MFPCTKNHRFPFSPPAGIPGPSPSEPAAEGPRALTPELAQLPSPPGKILAFQIHLNCAFEAEPSRSPISCSASSPHCSDQSPGVWKVFAVLSSVQIFVLFLLQVYGLLRGFCLHVYPQPLAEAEQGENTLVSAWVNIGEGSLEAWLFLEVDVNKLINWAAGIAESGIRRLPWALFLHPLSLFPSERGLHSWTGSLAVAAAGGMLCSYWEARDASSSWAKEEKGEDSVWAAAWAGNEDCFFPVWTDIYISSRPWCMSVVTPDLQEIIWDVFFNNSPHPFFFSLK